MVFSYRTIRELAGVLGRDKLIEIVFGIRLRACVSPRDRLHPSLRREEMYGDDGR